MMNSSAGLRLSDLNVEQFLALLASDQPVPGGGSAAALAGAMSAALVRMTARLTLGRRQYAACQSEMLEVSERSGTLQTRLEALVAEDAQAYRVVLAAYALPKSSEAERTARTEAIQTALRGAAETPLRTAEACAELVELAAYCTAHGNRNAASDAAVSALLAQAALKGAVLNVRTNLSGIRDEAFNSAAEARLRHLLDAGEGALQRALTAAGLGE